MVNHWRQSRELCVCPAAATAAAGSGAPASEVVDCWGHSLLVQYKFSAAVCPRVQLSCSMGSGFHHISGHKVLLVRL
jgi:hypothetical protein